MKTARSHYADALPTIAAMRAEGKTIPEISKVVCLSERQIGKYIRHAAENGNPIPKARAIREGWYLGKLCPKGHDYNGLGQSLRKSDCKCTECDRAYYRAYNKIRYGNGQRRKRDSAA